METESPKNQLVEIVNILFYCIYLTNNNFIWKKDTIKKKFLASQEENKKLRKELAEKSDKLYKDPALGI